MIRYDDMLNGGAAAPAYVGPTPAQPLPQTGQGGRTDLAGGATNADNPRAVLMVWFALLAILVVSHVVTLSVQR